MPAGLDVGAAELPAGCRAREGAAAHGAGAHAGARQAHGPVPDRPRRQPGHHGARIVLAPAAVLTLYSPWTFWDLTLAWLLGSPVCACQSLFANQRACNGRAPGDSKAISAMAIMSMF